MSAVSGRAGVVMSPPDRKVVQITSCNLALYALCDDGTVWVYGGREGWSQLQEIPQP